MVILFDMGIGGARERLSKPVLAHAEYLLRHPEIIREHHKNVYDEGTQEDSEDYLPEIKSPEELFADKEFAEYADRVIKTFPPAEQKVLRLRFYANKEMTLNEVGEALGMNRNTVATTEARALKRLGLPSRLGSMFESPSETALPETLKLEIKDKDARVKVEVSKRQFETIVMKIFDEQKQITTPGKIADELGCNPLFVSYAINRIVSERARNARSGAEPAQTPNKNPDTGPRLK